MNRFGKLDGEYNLEQELAYGVDDRITSFIHRLSDSRTDAVAQRIAAYILDRLNLSVRVASIGRDVYRVAEADGQRRFFDFDTNTTSKEQLIEYILLKWGMPNDIERNAAELGMARMGTPVKRRPAAAPARSVESALDHAELQAAITKAEEAFGS